jgi:tRNA pseudouridine38-40 synthase
MQTAAGHLVGEHDFAAFRAANCAAKTTIRRIFFLTVLREGDLIFIDVHGSGFLKNMVRVIAGTLVEVGLGKRSAGELPAMIASGSRGSSGATAPPQGLCLMTVSYE